VSSSFSHQMSSFRSGKHGGIEQYRRAYDRVRVGKYLSAALSKLHRWRPVYHSEKVRVIQKRGVLPSYSFFSAHHCGLLSEVSVVGNFRSYPRRPRSTYSAGTEIWPPMFVRSSPESLSDSASSRPCGTIATITIPEHLRNTATPVLRGQRLHHQWNSQCKSNGHLKCITPATARIHLSRPTDSTIFSKLNGR
jgi:hypothetical protein